MRSFQDEIAAASSSSSTPPVAVFDLMLDSNDSESELGYLLEASYDELGLSPSTAASTYKVVSRQAELVRVASEASGIGEFWEFEDRIPSYDDSFQLGAEEARMAQEMRRARDCAGAIGGIETFFREPADADLHCEDSVGVALTAAIATELSGARIAVLEV
ncbi:hypothetical protein NL676_029744 [Syzygium grande]|nr:hypothetical protein NL676_029744 [Syzygium grande]